MNTLILKRVRYGSIILFVFILALLGVTAVEAESLLGYQMVGFSGNSTTIQIGMSGYSEYPMIGSTQNYDPPSPPSPINPTALDLTKIIPMVFIAGVIIILIMMMAKGSVDFKTIVIAGVLILIALALLSGIQILINGL
jgi:hypothetical protein